MTPSTFLAVPNESVAAERHSVGSRGWFKGLAATFVDKFLIISAFQFLLIGGLLGWLAWGGGPEVWRLTWILVLPLAWGVAKTRVAASMLVAGYFLVTVREIPVVSVVFFGDSAPRWIGWALWGAACVLMTAPFTLFWSSRRHAIGWRFLGAVIISAIPPWAIVGWMSPLAVAGVIFPGLGWAGLVFALAMMSALVGQCWKCVAVLAILSIVANGAAVSVDVKVPSNWQGVDTNFAGLSGAGRDDASQLLAGMQRVEWVKHYALSVPANSVRVLPETVLGTFDGVSAYSLRETEAALTARGSRLLVGTELSQKNGQYKNVMLVLGSKKDEKWVAVQNIPIPYSMWKPWAADGVVANVFGRDNLVVVDGLKAGVVICYEQMLAYSLLWVMVNRPDVIVAVSNVWWARNTSVSNVQRQMVDSFGRLFRVAVVVARNL